MEWILDRPEGSFPPNPTLSTIPTKSDIDDSNLPGLLQPTKEKQLKRYFKAPRSHAVWGRGERRNAVLMFTSDKPGTILYFSSFILSKLYFIP